MIRYFVSYAHGNGGIFGYGWIQISRDEPIRDGVDIKVITQQIAEQMGAQKITILSWQRFEDSAEQTGSRP